MSSLFPQLLTYTTTISKLSLRCPTLSTSDGDSLSAEIGAELEAGRFLDGEIRELRAGIERRRVEKKRKREGKDGGDSEGLKKKLKTLQLELFDKTVDQAQMQNLIARLKLSQPALELLFPERYGGGGRRRRN